MEKKYHYFYKITNISNGNYYYGVHNTNDLNDGYFGSGTRIKYAIKKYGINNFRRDIIKFFTTSKEAFEFEASVVTEDLIKDEKCYNIALGGKNLDTTGKVVVRAEDGMCFLVDENNEEFLNGTLKGCTKGTVTIIGENNTYKKVNIEDFYRYSCSGVNYNKVLVKSSSGSIFLVDKNDERYLNGELTHVWKGRKHTEEAKEKMREAHRKNGYQKGAKNSQFGTIWINNGITNKKIKETDFEKYNNNGWTHGRLITPHKKKLTKISEVQ